MTCPGSDYCSSLFHSKKFEMESLGYDTMFGEVADSLLTMFSSGMCRALTFSEKVAGVPSQQQL
jgi:hypothetical protein